MSDEAASTESPAWSPLTAKQRRVLGTLMEKSKTTPDAYPMTLTGLTTGCNQKSNRHPVTNLTQDQVENLVDELKQLGAVTLVHGNGRVEKVRHYAYQWMGLSKVEAAVMTELLLRGHQTLGDLRTRASRMEPIPDLAELQTLLNALEARRLVVKLTPSGRGQIVSHGLYPEWELEALQREVDQGGAGLPNDASDDEPRERGAGSERARGADDDQRLQALEREVESLRQRLAHLEKELGVAP